MKKQNTSTNEGRPRPSTRRSPRSQRAAIRQLPHLALSNFPRCSIPVPGFVDLTSSVCSGPQSGRSQDVVTFANWRGSSASSGKLFVYAEEVAKNDVALLLGTSPKVGNHPSIFCVERIKATTALQRPGKVRGILISGDNSKPNYNEPDHMKKYLIEAGIPAEFITCDYAGLEAQILLSEQARYLD